jgi:hypothetical protein
MYNMPNESCCWRNRIFPFAGKCIPRSIGIRWHCIQSITSAEIGYGTVIQLEAA